MEFRHNHHAHLSNYDFFFNNYKYPKAAGHRWLTPIILVTWEADIRRIKIGSQPEQAIQRTPSPK
jgi:hypothetical protein